MIQLWEDVNGYLPKSKGNRLDSLHRLPPPYTFDIFISILAFWVYPLRHPPPTFWVYPLGNPPTNTFWPLTSSSKTRVCEGEPSVSYLWETIYRNTRLRHSSLAVVGSRLYGDGSSHIHLLKSCHWFAISLSCLFYSDFRWKHREINGWATNDLSLTRPTVVVGYICYTMHVSSHPLTRMIV